MTTLRTGLVIAGGYADKVRRVLFAQLRDAVKRGDLSNSEVARAAGEINRLLFEILVNRLGIDKGDVVRVSVEYEVVDGRVEWKFDTLSVQVWRRAPDEDVSRVVQDTVSKAEEILAGGIRLQAEKAGETDTGDLVFLVKYGERSVGAILVTPLDGEALVRGAITEPTPLKLPRVKLEVGEDVEGYIREGISEIMEKASNVERREAEKIVREIMALVEAAREEPMEEEEVE